MSQSCRAACLSQYPPIRFGVVLTPEFVGFVFLGRSHRPASLSVVFHVLVPGCAGPAGGAAGLAVATISGGLLRRSSVRAGASHIFPVVFRPSSYKGRLRPHPFRRAAAYSSGAVQGRWRSVANPDDCRQCVVEWLAGADPGHTSVSAGCRAESPGQRPCRWASGILRIGMRALL